MSTYVFVIVEFAKNKSVFSVFSVRTTDRLPLYRHSQQCINEPDLVPKPKNSTISKDVESKIEQCVNLGPSFLAKP